MIPLFVEGIGLCGPGLAGWALSLPILTGKTPYVPAPLAVPPASLLPANERRRAPQSVRLALAAGAEAFEAAGMSPATTPAVFASSGGDGETIHSILETLAGPDPALSPTRFHNSVHNVAAGYWSIATGARTPATSLCAHDGSFAAGLIEAGAQAMAERDAVVLIAYDLPYPGPLALARLIPEALAVALVLSPAPRGVGRMRIDLNLSSHRGAVTAASPPDLEPMRRTVPAARCLPLLAALACRAPAEITLDYLDDLALHIRVGPADAA
ncbi:MAG: beta-ketoacyl synthase chain length factor [Proteobacteria bacterium]|nr:beta-ketoacyl synthase chain length factor [Pseudomonadota bacterium]